MTGNAKENKPLVLSCLDENPKVRPVIVKVLEKVKESECHYKEQEKQNQQQLRQQQEPVLQTQSMHPQFEGLLFKSRVAYKPRVAYTLCKSHGCSSEMIQGFDGYFLECYANNLPTKVS